MRQVLQLLSGDVFHPECDFFRTSDLEALPLFHRLNKLARLQQRFVSTCIQPGKSTTQVLNIQFSEREILPVEIGNFKLAAEDGLSDEAISETRRS